ncbi:MAG: peptidoglycan DD-metalloendopeptidase family protein [Bacilli bacterium]|nr:peptidoglycan DD-metalloendopeptidase family protein [Bacilli bacterium]
MDNNDDYIFEDEVLDYETYSEPNSTRKAYEKGKQKGAELGRKIQDGSLKEDFQQVKSGINDIKSGDIKEGIEKVKDGVLDNRNTVEKTGSTIKNTGKTMQKAGESMEKVGKSIKKGSEAGEKVAKGVEKGAKVADKSGKALEAAGKATEAAGTATKATGTAVGTAGDAINAAGAAADATVVGAVAGVPLNAVGTAASAAGKVAQGVGTAEQAAGMAEQAAGKGVQAGAKGVEAGAKGLDLGSKIGRKFGDGLEKAGKITKDAGEKVEKVGEKTQQTGKDLKNFTKPFTGTADVIKKLPKILLIASIISAFLFIGISYYKSISPTIESMEKFTNFFNDNEDFQSLTSGIYTGSDNNSNNKFYAELNKWYYKSNGQLDVPLVFSVLFYTDIDNSDNEFDFSLDEDDDGEDFSDIMSLDDKTASAYTKGKIKRLRLLCKNMLNGKNKVVSDDEFKEFLRTKYIPKKTEFKDYLDGLSDEEKDKKIESIINEMYEYREWYVQVYGDGKNELSSEDYEDSCVGAINKELVKELTRPIDVSQTITFSDEDAFGVVNGKKHNGVNLTFENSGVRIGHNVYSIADGIVIDVGTDDSLAGTTDASQVGSETIGKWIKIKHENIVIGETKYNFYSVYKNLQFSAVKKGDTVSKGNVIGKIGKSSDDKEMLYFEFRNENNSPIDPTNLFIECVSGGVLSGSDDEEKIWNYFLSKGYPKAGVAGIMGNMFAESGLISYRVQSDFTPDYSISKLYTEKVDDGSVSEYDFVNKGPGGGGYGLAQWTYYTRKQALYNYKKEQNTSIGDLKMQLEFYDKELESSYGSVYNVVTTTTNYESACRSVLLDYESPANKYNKIGERNAYCKTYYDKYATTINN